MDDRDRIRKELKYIAICAALSPIGSLLLVIYLHINFDTYTKELGNTTGSPWDIFLPMLPFFTTLFYLLWSAIRALYIILFRDNTFSEEANLQKNDEPEIIHNNNVDLDIIKAQQLAEIEMQKAEHMTRLRLAEAQGLAGIAAEVAEKEEARQDRQLDKLTKI